MKTLELYYPTKPFIVTQEWGVPNEMYRRFGFWAHNGIDFLVDKDKTVKAMCDGVVTWTGNIPDGAGIFLHYRTDWITCEGEECYVEFVYMHAEKLLVKMGDKVKAGQDLIIADNTGFSTGEHTHISGIRLDKYGNRLGNDLATNKTFDFSKYFNGKYADDIETKTAILPFDTDLKYMTSGEEIKRLQEALKKLGYFPVTEKGTGYYGDITRKAVFDFQQDHVPLTPWEYWVLKGRTFGPKTRAVINNLIKNL